MATRLSIKPGQFIILVVVTASVFTFVYNYGMTNWENQSQTLIQSLEVVFQSFLTTGYGQDAPWETTRMNILVIGMQLSGVGLILAGINAFVVPWFRTILHAPALPERIDLEEHVVICGYTSRIEAFAEVLDAREVPLVIIVGDEDNAIQVNELGWPVIHGAPDTVESLNRANVAAAVAVVADASDEVNASIALSTRELNAEIPVIAVIEQEDLSRYQRLAGADEILSPRHILGESLANRMMQSVSTTVGESIRIADDVELVEVTVSPDHDCCNRPLSECNFEERFGLTAVAAYFDNGYEAVGMNTYREIDENTRILLVGTADAVHNIRSESKAQFRDDTSRDVLLIGYGETGKATKSRLEETNTEITVVDIEDRPGVDVVGDAREPETLVEAGISDKTAAIITVADDTAAIFTTLIMADLNKDIEIFVRAIEEDHIPQLHRAGAADVHSLAATSGEMIAATIMADNALFAFAGPIRRRKVGDGSLPGKMISEIELENDIEILLLLREGKPISYEEAKDVVIKRGDELIISGIGNEIPKLVEPV